MERLTVFDEDKCARANNRMWLKLARNIEAYAHELAASGDVMNAARAGEVAEACYWQATGQGDFQGLKAILTSAPE